MFKPPPLLTSFNSRIYFKHFQYCRILILNSTFDDASNNFFNKTLRGKGENYWTYFFFPKRHKSDILLSNSARWHFYACTVLMTMFNKPTKNSMKLTYYRFHCTTSFIVREVVISRDTEYC